MKTLLAFVLGALLAIAAVIVIIIANVKKPDYWK